MQIKALASIRRSWFLGLASVLAIVVVLLATWSVPVLAQTSAWRSLSGVVWGAGLPAFSYPFHKKPLVLYDGGTTKQVGTYDFPVSKGMAGV